MSFQVVLRPVTESDLPTLFAHQDDPVVRAMGVIPHRAKEEFFQKWKEVLADTQLAKQSIWVDEQLVGNMVCFLRDGVHEIGYVVGRDHWGKGIASAALAQFLPLISHLPRPITARVVKHNFASLRVLQKNGFLIVAEMTETDPQGRHIPEFRLSLAEEPNQ